MADDTAIQLLQMVDWAPAVLALMLLNGFLIRWLNARFEMEIAMMQAVIDCERNNRPTPPGDTSQQKTPPDSPGGVG